MYMFNSGRNWQTYSDRELGFEVKYPEEWRTEECRFEQFGIVAFGNATGNLLICNSDATPTANVLVQVGGPASQYDLLLKNLQDNLDNVKKSDTTLGGEPAVEIYGESRQIEGPGLPAGVKMTQLFTKKGDRIYSISHWNVENKDYMNEYGQMVESFRFLD